MPALFQCDHCEKIEPALSGTSEGRYVSGNPKVPSWFQLPPGWRARATGPAHEGRAIFACSDDCGTALDAVYPG